MRPELNRKQGYLMGWKLTTRLGGTTWPGKHRECMKFKHGKLLSIRGNHE